MQDSQNPKPLTGGIAEELPRQLAPSVGNLLARGTASATSSPADSTSPIWRGSITFGSFDFVPHVPMLQAPFRALHASTAVTFGLMHFNLSADGMLQLPEPIPSEPSTTSAATTVVVSSATATSSSASASPTLELSSDLDGPSDLPDENSNCSDLMDQTFSSDPSNRRNLGIYPTTGPIHPITRIRWI